MATLEARDLTKDFRLGHRQVLRAVDGLSLDLVPGRTVALVGESGSGKSTVAGMLAQLLRPTSGTIRLDGDPAGRHGGALRRYRQQVQIVFQDPFAALNPYHSVDHHLRRPLRLHRRDVGRADEDERIEQLLERVSLVPARRVAGMRPHELSGGQRQRVAIARALAARPGVLLADEPVSMLDVSIRLEILNLIDRCRHEDDLAVLYITHDLATARHFAGQVMVMYRGEVVESGPSDDVILTPRHPYTQLLAAAAPDPRRPRSRTAPGRRPMAGQPVGTGCRFRDRCPFAMASCERRPPMASVGTDHQARCWLHAEDGR